MRLTLLATSLLAVGVTAAPVTDPAIIHWMINTDGTTGTSTDATVNAAVSGILADVQRVRYDASDVYIDSPGVPSHTVGPFSDGNPAVPSDREHLFRVPRTPPGEFMGHPETPLSFIGVFVNGVTFYNQSDAMSYQNQGVWNNNAIVVRADGFDSALGHPSPNMMMGPPPGATAAGLRPPSPPGALARDARHGHRGVQGAHRHTAQGIQPMAPGMAVEGTYHYHQQPTLLREQLGDDGNAHSPLLGFAFDGVPVYGPFGYANPDGSGGVARIASSYQLRSITQRTTLADGTVLTPSQYGPAINATYPLGYFIEDFEYVMGLGHLDEHNGRMAVTPEYPGGVYHYVTTIDESGESAFPYIVGERFYAQPLMDNLMDSVSEPGGLTEYTPPDEPDGANGLSTR